MTNRYSRQTVVKELGELGQEKLANAHIAIIGMGGLGSPASLYLAGAGVGELTLIDHDTVSLSNLHRQTLYRESDIGQPKVNVAKQTLSDLNHDVTFNTYAKKLSADNIHTVLTDVGVVVDATDNFAISYLLSDYCLANGKPLVSASVMQTAGYVGVYCYSTALEQVCPSLRAVFPNPPAAGQNCNSVGVIGTAAGIIGLLQAQEVLKVILGDAQQLAGRLLSMDLWSYRQSIMDFNGADEPEYLAEIIAESAIQENDWVIDVRTPKEIEQSPKQSQQQTPLLALALGDLSELAKAKRLVFTCASGQRALAAADQALSVGYTHVAVWV